MSALFHTILYQPIFNLFIFLYNVVPGHDVGIVILIVTVLVRLALYPLTTSSIKAQKSMSELQPKLEALKKQYPDDKQKQAQATMELYKTHKINPLSSCLPMLIQLPILLALFWVMRDSLESHNIAQNLYPFVVNPGTINPLSLGFINLAAPSVVLAVLAGLAQFLQAKTMTTKQPPKAAGESGKDEGMAAMMNKQMLYMMPVLTVVIGIKFPAGLTLYWFLSTVLMVLQQMIITKKSPFSNPPPAAGENVIEGTIVK